MGNSNQTNQDYLIYQNYIKKIIDFNSDKELIALREQYNRPSFFEIISKQRSETTYSSLLKWLFQIENPHLETASSIMMLLDILLHRSIKQEQEKLKQEQEQEKEKLIDEDLQTAILSRKLKIQNIKVETEKSVGQLAEALNKDNTDLDDKILNGIKRYCKDRIDIFIECKAIITNDDVEDTKPLQIIIENKIDSAEGGPHENKKIPSELKEFFKKKQTCRYYCGTHRKDIYQIYVYLTPDENNECEDEHFIKITYQDILDRIILPLLNLSSISARDIFLLEEFKNELMFPNLDNIRERSSIAISEETTKTITEVWKKHKELIIDSIIAYSESKYWVIKDTYYVRLPKEKDKKGEAVKKEIKGKSEKLLRPFYLENEKIISAFMDAIEQGEREKIECFFEIKEKKHRTKYTIYYDGERYGKSDMNNFETVYHIVKLWAEEHKNELPSDSDRILNKLREKFPLKLNKYYAQGKWFKNLIYKYREDGKYEFDGSEISGGEATNWDFYKPNPTQGNSQPEKGSFEVNGTKITLLKMWREEGVESVIKHAIETLHMGNKLEIVRIK